MFVNNEYAFTENSKAFEQLNAKLNELADTDFHNSTAGGILQHTVYTSSLVRYAIFNLKAALLNPIYSGDEFVSLRSLLAEVDAELNKDDRGYSSLLWADMDMAEDGVAYVSGHDPAGKMEELLKQLQVASKEDHLLGQYYSFIRCCVAAHDNVKGNEW